MPIKDKPWARAWFAVDLCSRYHSNKHWAVGMRWASEIVKQEKKKLRIILLRRVLKILKLFADDGRNLIPFFIENCSLLSSFFRFCLLGLFQFQWSPVGSFVCSCVFEIEMMLRLKLFPLFYSRKFSQFLHSRFEFQISHRIFILTSHISPHATVEMETA